MNNAFSPSDIRQILGTPFHQSEYGLIYNMDCREGLLKLKDGNSVNGCITSPPYNIGKEYETTLPTAAYIGWLSEILGLVADSLCDSGMMMLNVGYLQLKDRGHAVPIPYLLWDKVKMYLQQEIVWHYRAGVASKKYLSPRNEKILWYVKTPDRYTFNLDEIRDPDVLYPNQKKNGRLRCNSIGKNPSDVWDIAKVTSGSNRSSEERTSHPAQFPLDMIDRLVKGFTNPDDLILDPFMGSGTVAVSAIRNNRFYLGFEINESYCRMAAERIEKEIRLRKCDIFSGYQAV